MVEVLGEILKDRVRLILHGRIDSGNASEIEAAVSEIIQKAVGMPIEIAMDDLSYISSSGLRVILRLRKSNPDITISGVRSDVYEILEMTGFTDMMKVHKAYREVSLEGAEEIGRGANGVVYRIDQDNVVKVYFDENALEEIQNERIVARKALILGIPTAISYDIVRVGSGYGSVFELLNATSFSKIIANEPEKIDWCVAEYVSLLKRIHSTRVPKGELPDAREAVISWAEFMRDYLPEAYGRKLLRLIKAIPQNDHMIHGDYHTKNVELVNGEVLLIDMDTLAVGHPVIELASMYNSFIGFSEYDPTIIEKFQGFDAETGRLFFHKALAAYLGTDDEDRIRKIEDKARIVGYTRMIRRSIRRGGLDTENGRAEIELWKGRLIELLDRIDSLLFAGSGMKFEANRDNLSEVQKFVNENLDETEGSEKTKMQISIAIEEIFINICNYAYPDEQGTIELQIEIDPPTHRASFTFIDSGIPYDPLAKEDPDVTLSAEERPIGGLGVFMVKQLMDTVNYRREDGKNILFLQKRLI